MIEFKDKFIETILEKEKGLKRKRDGSFIWRDIVKPDLPFEEQEWVLNFKESDIPNLFKSIFKIHNIEGRKSFVVRDLYKIFTGKDYYLSIAPEQKWWFEILMDKNIQTIKYLTLHKPILAKTFANLLALVIAKEIKKIEEILGSGNNSKDLKDEINTTKEKIGELKSYFGKGKGYGTYWSWKFSEPKKLYIPPEIMEKIKGIGYKIRGYFYSLQKEQSIDYYPRNSDPSLAEEILFLDKINKGFSDLDNRVRNLRVDLYLDISGSMRGERMLYLKGMVKELKRAGLRFRNIYAFCEKLLRIREKDIWDMDTAGGTRIEAVLINVEKNSSYSVIISDMEDHVTQFSNILKKVESKVSLIQIGDKNTYEKWKNYVGIAYFIECNE